MLHGAIELGRDSVGGFGPDERFGAGIVLGAITVTGGLQIGDRGKDAAADEMQRHLGEEVLDAPG
jgi:hypothetical protein